MKKTESNNLEAKKPIQVRLNPKDGLSSKEQNQKTDQEKTQETKLSEVYDDTGQAYYANGEMIENAEIVPQIDEIIKNNDKFETIKVLMEILCKELDIPKDSQIPVIAKALNGVFERYMKSIEDWKNLVKMGIVEKY